MIDVVAHYGEPAMTWLVAALLVQRERQRWHHAIARTLDEGDDSDAVPGLPGWTAQSRFAILALQRLPERALALVRASLRSTTPACAAEIAALLTAIDQPWCRRELAAARAEVGEPPQLFVPEAALVAELRARYPADWDG